jgi:GT2 family glycosyltransferase
VTQLAIIILNYRTPQLTEACLASLETEIDRSIRVLVVDNDSRDGSADYIERAIETRGFGAWAEVLRSPVNGGFAAGNDFGIRALDAEAYVLLNSDTLVQPGAIARLREAMALHPEAGIIGPQLLTPSGELDPSYFRDPVPGTELLRSARLGILGRALERFEPTLPPPTQPFEPDWIAFACALIRREVIERVGLLDEGYFMYFEDVDYCRRARAAGFKVLYWPEAKVVHLRGGSSNITTARAERKRAPRYYYEARARYYAKFYGRKGLWLANGLWHLGRCISLSREVIGRTEPRHREREALDIWTNALSPLRGAP